MMQQTALALFIVIIATGGAFAAKLKPLGTFGSWSAWSYVEKGRRHCFIYASPSRKEPATLDHGTVTFFVRTTRQGAHSEASLQTGYDFAAGSPIRAVIGNREFHMVSSGNSAWLHHSKREREFVDSLKGGHDLAIHAKSKRGNETAYRFALDGVTKAMERIRSACL